MHMKKIVGDKNSLNKKKGVTYYGKGMPKRARELQALDRASRGYVHLCNQGHGVPLG